MGVLIYRIENAQQFQCFCILRLLEKKDMFHFVSLKNELSAWMNWNSGINEREEQQIILKVYEGYQKTKYESKPNS